MTINTNNIAVDDNGRVSFSGLSSGIDFQSSVDAIITAKRAQAVQIENRISQNTDKITVFNELKELSSAFATTLNVLRGSTSVLDDDIFNSKQAFTDSRVAAGAPGGHVASSAGEILGVTVDSDALNGRHTVEVVQLATAHQIRSDVVSDKTTDLTTLGFTAGTFQLNGKDITLTAGDTLLDLRDKINTTNTGAGASNVSASIVSASATEHYLVLTSTETGAVNEIVFTGDQAVHNSFGLTSAGTDTVKNELQSGEDSIIRVDGLGVDITRSSNVINDVLEGVTLNLFKAEENTEIVIDVETDLNAIKTSIVDFVNAFNDLKAFVLDQRTETVRVDGGSPELGPLAFDTTLRQIESKLGELLAAEVPGIEDGYSSLGQVGIEVGADFLLTVDDTAFDEKLLADSDAMRRLFAFDFSTSDSRVSVISHTSDTTYTVDGTNTPEPYYLNIAGTDASGDVTDANIKNAAGVGAGGLGDGSIVKNGNALSVTDISSANGLRLFFNGGANSGPVDDIEISFTIGVADRLFTFFDEVSKVGGVIDDAADGIRQSTTNMEERVAQIDLRLDRERQRLTDNFVRMETALAQFNSLLDQIKQQTEALNGGE